MSEDAHEIAQRIVREVLDAHESEAVREAPTLPDRTAGAGDLEQIDLREAGAAVAADATAAVLDDSAARQTARRIVAEVLASHAEAERDTSDGLPVVAEGEAPGPASATPVLHPVTGRPAVLPSLPDQPDIDDEADLADDAAAIARRIVASVLNQRAPADDGPPPVPDHVRARTEVASPPVEPAESTEPAGPVASDEPAEPVEDAEDAAELGAGADDPDATVSLDPVVASGSHRLTVPEPSADPDPDPDPEPEAAREPASLSEPDPAPESSPEPSAESTAPLTPDEPADPDATLRAPVVTLERPVVRDAAAEPTIALPSAEPPRRTGRWLLASIFGAVALAVLLPLAIQALRTLVSLS